MHAAHPRHAEPVGGVPVPVGSGLLAEQLLPNIGDRLQQPPLLRHLLLQFLVDCHVTRIKLEKNIESQSLLAGNKIQAAKSNDGGKVHFFFLFFLLPSAGAGFRGAAACAKT